MKKFNNGMRAYSEALTAMTAAGLACGSAVLSAIFAKSAFIEGSAKDAGIALGGASFAAGSGLAAWRSMKKLAGMANGKSDGQNNQTQDNHTPSAPK